MSVKCNLRLPRSWFATFRDWLKKIAPFSQPIRSITTTNHDLIARPFPHITHVTCIFFRDLIGSLCFFAFVMDQSAFFGFRFTKTVLIAVMLLFVDLEILRNTARIDKTIKQYTLGRDRLPVFFRKRVNALDYLFMKCVLLDLFWKWRIACETTEKKKTSLGWTHQKHSFMVLFLF